MFSQPEKDYLLNLARRSIKNYLGSNQRLKISEDEVPSKRLKEERACFVTLTIEEELRGCIGHILPIQELYQDVIDNAVSAAFQDPRFFPLTGEELQKVKIEISILTVPQLLLFTSPSDLLIKLQPGKDGVILKKNYQQATFLPQVWEELPKKEDFLKHLCEKAGLSSNCWQEKDLKIETYQVEAFEE